MKWIKKGQIFDPKSRFEWMNAYAQVPTILELNGCLRIYFTCRPKPDENGNMISLISYIEVEHENPKNISYISDKQVLPLGNIGTFDEFGLHPTNFIIKGDEIWFYYQGWTREYSVPYHTSLGLAISKDNGKSFKKYSEGPIFGRNINDPLLTNGFFVYPHDDQFVLFYASCSEWFKTEDGKTEPIYHLKSAVSKDGLNWITNSIELIDKKYSKESAGRPMVLKINGMYHMWFCFRDVESFRGKVDGAYRIGYAYSHNLIDWIRKDELSGIELSETGWDSEMMAYPFVQKINEKYYMFYNGNDFGKHGFGYAELEITN
jgi:hypothetical protein